MVIDHPALGAEYVASPTSSPFWNMLVLAIAIYNLKSHDHFPMYSDVILHADSGESFDNNFTEKPLATNCDL